MNLEHKELVKRIIKGREQLEIVGQSLKKRFVGIDAIIDSVIENITVWYIMPEIISRPVILNLWGMTGVGKTDLVRNLVKELSMMDKFVEIQMSNRAQGYRTTIKSILSGSSIDLDSPGILLLDEIQRFRTVQSDGSESHDHDFQDVWMLLSDGKFSGSSGAKEDLLDMIMGDVYWAQEEKEAKEREDDDEDDEDDEEEEDVPRHATKKAKKRQRKYHQSYYTAQMLRKKLKLTETPEDIMQWDGDKKTEMLNNALKNQDTFEGDSYSKLLIIISGNLDEAYTMSNRTEDADVDADVFHDFSSKISFVHIKAALRNRFKPEQISRMGNTHIIYPSLSKNSYSTIIERKIDELLDMVKSHGVDIKIDQSVKDFIYRNGVFPAQGVRPVLSTISAVLGNAIPIFILRAIELGEKNIKLRHEGDFLVAKMGKEEVKCKAEGSIDKIKKSHNIEKRMAVSVHEAGHAVAYAHLFKLAPTQLMSNVSALDSEGFMGIHDINSSKTTLLDKMCVYYAAQSAEEMVFGENHKTAGCYGDIEQATSLAGGFIRDLGMNGYVSSIANPYGCSNQRNFDIDETNNQLEKLLKCQKERATEILKNHKAFYLATVDELVKFGKIKPERFKEIAAKNGLEIDVKAAKVDIYADYTKKYEDFKES